jgi:hydrogenase maturation protein HypF
MTSARRIHVRGIVQGVGFRPFVYRLAQANRLAGWVLNQERGVEIHIEGGVNALDAFVQELSAHPPPAAQIASIEVQSCPPTGLSAFAIRESARADTPTVRISPDLPICDACLRELFDPADRRFRYPYINCTDCGPRYTVIEALPYDRANTTMRHWPMDEFCAAQYHDPNDRRFHAQPLACPRCGPQYLQSIQDAARQLNEGRIVAIKGIGGYHVACDARNASAVLALRERKFRKEKPFALMVRTIEAARELVTLSPEAEHLLTSPSRPIVLAPARVQLEGVSPDNCDLGIMLPYAPLHHLLFEAGAPSVLVMTSGNRSSEPIAYQDEDARTRLAGITDTFLTGERPIARRVDDSIARAGALGPVILRRSRGYAPAAVASIPSNAPILAVGPDLKNTVTLVIAGQAFVGQHIGDLSDAASFEAFRQTILDLTSMYEVPFDDLIIAHDAHPEYSSTLHALQFPALRRCKIQHHRAHVASVLAEHEAWDDFVLGISLDGTGYGDDGTIWGGEFFYGSMRTGFKRVAHLRPALLPGGDAASRYPVQCAAGFLHDFPALPPVFNFPQRYQDALKLLRSGVRTFRTTSTGRLFDAAAALLGFTHPVSFEGQAAMWLEHQARSGKCAEPYPFPFKDGQLDYRPLLEAVIRARVNGTDLPAIAKAFQLGIAHGIANAACVLSEQFKVSTVVVSGGVFQNEMLLNDLSIILQSSNSTLLSNHAVPPNDGGISLGQAALAAFDQAD